MIIIIMIIIIIIIITIIIVEWDKIKYGNHMMKVWYLSKWNQFLSSFYDINHDYFFVSFTFISVEMIINLF